MIGPILASVMLVLGAAHWLGFAGGAPAVSAPQSQQPDEATAATSVYFPAQYVNQATAIEEHIQAF